MLRLRPRYGANTIVTKFWTGKYNQIAVEEFHLANFYSNSYHLAHVHHSFPSNAGKSSKMFASWDLHYRTFGGSTLGSCTRKMIRDSENIYFYRVLMKGGRARVLRESGRYTPENRTSSKSKRLCTENQCNYKMSNFDGMYIDFAIEFLHTVFTRRSVWESTLRQQLIHTQTKNSAASPVSWSSGTSMSLQ